MPIPIGIRDALLRKQDENIFRLKTNPYPSQEGILVTLFLRSEERVVERSNDWVSPQWRVLLTRADSDRHALSSLLRKEDERKPLPKPLSEGEGL